MNKSAKANPARPRQLPPAFWLAHLLLLTLLVCVFLPGAKQVPAVAPFLAAIGLIEACYLYRSFLAKNRSLAGSDILLILWGILLLWEIFTTKLALLHPVLFPTPEAVFHVFASQYPLLLAGVVSSLQLLLIGFTLGLTLGVWLGLIVGWTPRLKRTFFPIAQVLTPISPIIYAPYLVAIMPTFRSASALVILLGIFWPTFLNMILRVAAVERNILDSARALNVGRAAMVRQILLPYVLPGLVSGLKVTLTTSIMMLTFAEMMGATSGMGYYIINYTHYANYTNVVAGIILVGIVVTILNRLVSWIQARAIPWR